MARRPHACRSDDPPPRRACRSRSTTSCAVARRRPVEISAAGHAIASSRRAPSCEARVRAGIAVYGVNSGARRQHRQRACRRRLVRLPACVRYARGRSRSVPPYDRESVRAMMFARIAGMAAQADRACRRTCSTRSSRCSIAGVHPGRAHASDSIGVADLPQLSHLALPLIGEGEAEFGGATAAGRRSVAARRARAGRARRKDGLALISANAATITARRCRDRPRRGCSTALVALRSRCRSRAFAPTCRRSIRARQAARPAPGRSRSRRGCARCSTGSALFAPGARGACRTRCRLRVVAQVHGARAGCARRGVATMVETGAQQRRRESAVSSLPTAIMLSNGNFHVPALGDRARCDVDRACANRQASRVERCIKLHVAGVHRPAAATHAPRPRAFGFRDGAEDADGVVGRHPPRGQSGDRSTSFRCRRAPRTTRRWRSCVAEARRDRRTQARYRRRDRAARSPRRRSICALLDLQRLGAGARAAYAARPRSVPLLDVDRPLGPDVDAIDALAFAAGDFRVVADETGSCATGTRCAVALWPSTSTIALTALAIAFAHFARRSASVAARHERVYAVAHRRRGFLVHDSHARVPRAADSDRRTRRARTRSSRWWRSRCLILIRNVATGIRDVPRRRRRRGARHGDERAAQLLRASSCRSRCR